MEKPATCKSVVEVCKKVEQKFFEKECVTIQVPFESVVCADVEVKRPIKERKCLEDKDNVSIQERRAR